MTTLLPASTFATSAGVVAAGALLALAALHAYWAAGGAWGLREALGGRDPQPLRTLPGRMLTALVGLALLTGAAVLLGRVQVWGDGGRVLHWGAWVVAGALLLGAAINAAGRTRLERLGFAPLAALLGVLAAIAALAGPGA
jgi:hypothetical protein